jgi:AcrR family transcriptional regulator
VGRLPQISRPAIVEASLAIADERGLAGLTMHAVAQRLGVTPMALYRHVDDKADLLDSVVEALLTELPLPRAELPWEQRLRGLGQAVRMLARRHPAIFPLLLQRPANTPESRRVRDSVVAALEEAGLDPEAARRAERLVSTVILGFAASEAGGRFRGHSRKVLDDDFACLEQLIGHALQDVAASQPRSRVASRNNR